MAVSIDVNTEQHLFLLKGEIDSILNNRRLLLRFKRLRFEKRNEIQIPFRVENQMKTLNEIRATLSSLVLTFSLKKILKKN